MKLLYGTGNQAKLDVMRRQIASLPVELVGLDSMHGEIPQVTEDGNSLTENARKKALAYYEAFKIPCFSCDSGLYFDNVPEALQPGLHVRTVNGVYLTDDEMLSYYTGLARKYGMLRARYRHAFCLVLDEEHIYSVMDDSTSSELFLMTDTPHSAVRRPGFPLDSISIDISTKMYYYDLNREKLDRLAVKEGALAFLETYLPADKA